MAVLILREEPGARGVEGEVARGFAEGGVMVNQREFSRGRVDGIGDDGVVAAVGAVEEFATGVDLDLGGAGAFRDGFAGR